MFKIWTTIAEANLNHAVDHPIKHTALTYAAATAAGLTIGAVARKIGERDLQNKQNTVIRTWN